MTNKWEVIGGSHLQDPVIIQRVADGLAIASMAVDDDDGFPTLEQAIDIAHQIVDDWNFGCDELEAE